MLLFVGLLLCSLSPAVWATTQDCAVVLGRRPIYEIDRVSTVICNVSALNGGIIVVGQTPPKRGEDWWYGINNDDEVAYTSNINSSRYDISAGSKVCQNRLYIPKKHGAGVGVWAITTGRHKNDISVTCPGSGPCSVAEIEVCGGVIFMALLTEQATHLVAVNATSGRRMWSQNLQSTTPPKLRASPLQGCKVWLVYKPQKTVRDQLKPKEPMVQAFRLDGTVCYKAVLSGAAMTTSRSDVRGARALVQEGELRRGVRTGHAGLLLTTQHHWAVCGGGGSHTTHPPPLDPPPL